MKYLLDSNACIAIINKNASAAFEQSLNLAMRLGDSLQVPSISVHELWFGVSKSQRFIANSHNLIQFLNASFKVLDFDGQDARVAGEIRAELARRGTPIGPYDVLIAGQALARGLTLVTGNTREFSRVDGLKMVDWTQ
jgi:tRNA(fMet)-specific endonuclease VapC